MIKAVHALIYSDDPEATRTFLRDVLGWPFVVEPDSVPPWPIFKSGPSEMGIHPTSGGTDDDAYSAPLHHSISLMCDDIVATKAELEAKGRSSAARSATSGSGSPRTSSSPAPGRSSSTSRSIPRPTTCRSEDARTASCPARAAAWRPTMTTTDTTTTGTPLSIPALRTSIAGRVIAPDDAEYDRARTVMYGGGPDDRPAVIVKVANADDVVRVVALARETGLELAVRSGGHSARRPQRGRRRDRPRPRGHEGDRHRRRGPHGVGRSPG